MQNDFEDYRAYLRSVLAERTRRNPSYSLRAMARDLNIAPSFLSDVCKGKKNLSPSAATSIALRLGLSTRETELFNLWVQIAHSKDPDLKDLLKKQALRQMGGKTSQPRDLSLELFRVIADWYHIPILILTDIPEAQFTPVWIARTFGIPVVEAELALERLTQLELLQRDPSGRYRRSIQEGVFSSAHRDEALQRFHSQMLSRAIESLKTQAPEERYIGSETFAIHRDQVPGLKEKIDAFRREIVQWLDETAPADRSPTDIYHLDIAAFRLNQKSFQPSKAQKSRNNHKVPRNSGNQEKSK